MNNNSNPVKCEGAVHIALNTLKMIDNRLVGHGERVAFIAGEMYKCLPAGANVEYEKLLALALFHDVGAYKTEEINHMFEFETSNVTNHSIYGYLFIKEFTPLSSHADGILYHHIKSKYFIDKTIQSDYSAYAQIIHLADRVDILLGKYEDAEKFKDTICSLSGDVFTKEAIDLFLKANENNAIIDAIKSDAYIKEINDEISRFTVQEDEFIDYIRMIAYLIDFRSVFTVTHTATTAAITLELSKLMNLSETEIKELYYASYLHDIGKIATPLSILESSGKLDDKEMHIMKQHVDASYDIINGWVDDKIRDIAVRHHEKLDGSGYPLGLKADELTQQDRILAIADITSALVGTRSYKKPFSKEKVIEILHDMADKNLLCKKTVTMLCDNYDSILGKAVISADEVKNKYKKIAHEDTLLQIKFLKYT